MREQLQGVQAWKYLAFYFFVFTLAVLGTSVCLNPKSQTNCQLVFKLFDRLQELGSEKISIYFKIFKNYFRNISIDITKQKQRRAGRCNKWEQKNPLQSSSSLHLLENLILTRGFTNQKLKQKPYPFSMLSMREKGAVREERTRKNTTGYPLSWTIKVMGILNSIYFFPLYAALTDHFATQLNPETAKKSR